MANVYYEKDADRSLLEGRKVAVIGYGSQGHAHALNLQDSGIDVRVGLRPESSSVAKATAAGLRVLPVSEAAAEADLIVLLGPDTEHKAIFNEHIAPHLQRRRRAVRGPRLQRALQPGRCARRCRRGAGRAEGTRPPRAPHLHRGRRRAVPHRRVPGRLGQGP